MSTFIEHKDPSLQPHLQPSAASEHSSNPSWSRQENEEGYINKSYDEPESSRAESGISSVPTSGVSSHKSSVSSRDELRNYSPLQDQRDIIEASIETGLQKYTEILKTHIDQTISELKRQLMGEICNISQKVNKLEEMVNNMMGMNQSAGSSCARSFGSVGTSSHSFNVVDNKSGHNSLPLQLKQDSNRASQHSPITNGSVQSAEKATPTHERTSNEVTMNAESEFNAATVDVQVSLLL